MSKRKPKIPDACSVPRDPGWKNLTHPDRELSIAEIKKIIERKRGK